MFVRGEITIVAQQTNANSFATKRYEQQLLKRSSLTQVIFTDIVIVSYARTPIGAFNGHLASVKATQLGATAIRACIDKLNKQTGRNVENEVEDVYMGNVISANLGQVNYYLNILM